MSDIVERDEAIKVAMQALSDWAVTYASDMCDEDTVKNAIDRVRRHGTLAYIATATDGLASLQAEITSLRSQLEEARENALEEAAKVAERAAQESMGHPRWQNKFKATAAAIRKLKEKP